MKLKAIDNGISKDLRDLLAVNVYGDRRSYREYLEFIEVVKLMAEVSKSRVLDVGQIFKEALSREEAVAWYTRRLEEGIMFSELDNLEEVLDNIYNTFSYDISMSDIIYAADITNFQGVRHPVTKTYFIMLKPTADIRFLTAAHSIIDVRTGIIYEFSFGAE